MIGLLRKIVRVGNSYAITIPEFLLTSANLDTTSPVVASYKPEPGRLTITIEKAPRISDQPIAPQIVH